MVDIAGISNSAAQQQTGTSGAGSSESAANIRESVQKAAEDSFNERKEAEKSDPGPGVGERVDIEA
ncbi:MAG: hypothetical protein CMF31_10145 [Kordiimonas sp.]|nr:hypothetical protein [Kordiimonas sp.]|tara:strand:- start:42 stop:239 length:198 start_codon:yes stop_codon:yes gene_type:complete